MNKTEQIIIAGFGGQGIMSMGQMLTYAGMMEGKEVSWLPSYGPEMRGGTAYCNIVISDSPVASPIVTSASAVIVMNKSSLIKFESKLEAGGNLFVNSSLIDIKSTRDDISDYYISANEMANQIGNSRIANMILLGAYIEKSKIVSVDSVLEAMVKVLGENKRKLVPINKEALLAGAGCVK
ncbi:MAG: 2-oxoacid:ferredoxin oxidoreductase subunit gamma [Clostridiales bacterium]|nr:2-oxoacid:ferredoxin oxidoreductase subunit gamma [Clostridiales bacterium]